MKPKVLNKRTDKIPPDAVYVGRPSKWGNPFRVYPHKRGGLFAQKIAVLSYKEYLDEQIKQGNVGFGIQFKYNLEELQSRDLVCWCAPLSCHADILLELANKEVK